PASFMRLKALLQMEDGWRHTFRDERQYTCVQHRINPSTGLQFTSRSRLDRIYIKHNTFDSCRGWKIDQTQVRSDHSLATVQIVSRAEQTPGRGRFSLPLYLLKTRKFTEEVQRLGKVLHQDCDKLNAMPRTSDQNIQTLWAQFKRDTIEHAK
ncbi:hypothetical protein C8R46DRAFT_827996, partial [Mycena filopes]